MRKIGIMGGTFDPIHIGHLILGETAYEQFGLERVLFMPSGNPPHKRNREGRATDEQRVHMIRNAIQSNPHFELSLLEMNEEGYSYTYRTLEQLRKKNPDTVYYFIIGADSLFNFDTWMEPQRICNHCVMVVATRNGIPDSALNSALEDKRRKYNADFQKLDTINLDISSELLRERVRQHETIRYYVTDLVENYIKDNGIYEAKNSTEKI